ncbi:MAG: adenylosuccinate synthase [candidate division Zixibacteria bacterium]|nr:adenylosuccinate synthase [candidate division Zixibacteria bacterium]
MKHTAVVGSQWGDEGKGKIVDLLSEKADIVARSQGGANAGHTVIINGEEFILHLIPSGILHPEKVCLIGNGVVTDLWRLFDEIEGLKKKDVSVDGRMFISGLSHLVMPYHKWMEKHNEAMMGKNCVGTTLRGIGPTYTDKYSRFGIRVYDLFFPEVLKSRLEMNYRLKAATVSEYGEGDYKDMNKLYDQLMVFAEKLKPMVVDGPIFMEKASRDNKRILFEGAQGTLLDIDYGTFPYVTSSNTTIAGALTGLGVPPSYIHKTVGIVKAYQTRVGNGPFPTELDNSQGEALREAGKEYGASTGRPRRTGWLDLVLLKYAVRINGMTDLAITKLDVLDDLDEIKVCTRYELPEDRGEFLISNLDAVKPIYKTLKGWKKPIKGMTAYEDLPQETKEYIQFIEDYVACKATIISTGAGREDTIVIP